jgi:hypothetical protein
MTHLGHWPRVASRRSDACLWTKAHGHQKITTCPRETGCSCSSQKFTRPNGEPHERSFERVGRSDVIVGGIPLFSGAIRLDLVEVELRKAAGHVRS